jgi:hypothetical protein
MRAHAELVSDYLKFTDLRSTAQSTKSIDLKSFRFFTPTALLPLSIMLKKGSVGGQYDIKIPSNPDVAHYLELMTKEESVDALNRSTYLPVVSMPKDESRGQPILRKIFQLSGDPGGRNSFRYLVGELVDNIYQHSRFENGLVMAQQYPKKRTMHMCIIDDGITIAGSLREAGLTLDDDQAIVDALQGTSSKKDHERGRGLGTAFGLTILGYGGCMLVVSGRGALYRGPDRQQRFQLSDRYKYEGTLISITIPLTNKEVDLYEYASL